MVERPVLTGQYDSRATVRAVRTFEICPRKYVLSQWDEEDFDFMFEIEDVVLYGLFDPYFEQDGQLILVGPSGSSPLELRLQALALERYVGRLPDRAMAGDLEVSLSLNDLKRAKYTVHEFLKAQNVSEFPLREGEHCRRCTFYRGLCPAGKI